MPMGLTALSESKSMMVSAQAHFPFNDNAQQEFALAALCCRWPASSNRAKVICDAANDAIDWDHFLFFVRRHRIVGLAAAALDSAKIVLPLPTAQKLDARLKRVRQNRLKRAAESVRLCNLLTAAGVHVIVLKGAALEQLAYGPLAVKQMRDIDLLVPPAQAEAALQVIESAGYALSSPSIKLNSTQRRALIRHGREIELFDPEQELARRIAMARLGQSVVA